VVSWFDSMSFLIQVLNNNRTCSSSTASVLSFAANLLLSISPAATPAVCLVEPKNSSIKQDNVKAEKQKRKRSADGDDDLMKKGPAVLESEFGAGEISFALLSLKLYICMLHLLAFPDQLQSQN
jgi:hypothetical protein